MAFRRLTDAFKSKLLACSSPSYLAGAEPVETVKKAAPLGGKVAAPARPPTYALAAVASPAAMAASPPAPVASPPAAVAKEEDEEEEATAVAPRIFSEVAPHPQAHAKQPSIPSEWLFSRSESATRPASRAEQRLPPLDHPADKLQAAIAMLSIHAPTDPQLALTTLRQLALHHPAVLEPHLGEAVPLVLRHVRCPLPGLSHTATVLFKDLLATYGDAMAPHCQDRRDPEGSAVLQLLLKAQAGPGAKSFVVDGAQLALRTLATSLSPPLAEDLLQPYTLHKQPPRLRAMAAALLEVARARWGETGPAGQALPWAGSAGAGALLERAEVGQEFRL